MAKSKSKSKPKKPVKKAKPLASRKVIGNVTPVKELERLARLAAECRDRSQTASGKIGGEIKEAVESKHLHAKAFRSVLAEIRMGQNDPIKLRDYLDAQEYYRDVLKVSDIKATDMMKGAAKSPRRPANGTKTLGEAAQEVVKEAKTNVVPLATAMQDAIEKDNAAKAEMDAA